VFLDSDLLKDSKPLSSFFPGGKALTETEISDSLKALIDRGFRAKGTDLTHKKGVLPRKNTPETTTKSLEGSIQKTYATCFKSGTQEIMNV
jgi:hypothetical protein